MENITKIAVIGAGLMGHGVSQVFAQAGYQVCMQSRREKSVQLAFQRIRANLKTFMKNNLIDKETADFTLARIKGTTNMVEAAKEADFVIESIPEILNLKKEVFKQLDRICPDHTILASNTTGLSINEIASATERQEKVVGTHFWNPPHLVQAVEVIRGDKTSDETLEITRDLLTKAGKKPVVIRKSIPGQIGIRILHAMLREAISLVEKGIATPEEIDTVVKGCLGARIPAIGIFEISDLSGVDLVLMVSKYLYKDLERSTEPSPLLKEMVKKGELGIKTGKGFYDWDEKKVAIVLKRRDEHLIKLLKEKQ